MARKPMITRTIQTTVANVLYLNIAEEKPFYETVTLPRTYKSEKDLFKAVEALCTDPNVKAVHVADTYVKETLYGMTEKEFIDHAQVLPPRKANDESEGE